MAYSVLLNAHDPSHYHPIFIGRETEDDVREILYDLRDPIENLGDGTFKFLMKPNGQEVYTVPQEQTRLEGTIAHWKLSEVNLLRSGRAVCQLEFYPYESIGSKQNVWKTPIYYLYIAEAFQNPGFTAYQKYSISHEWGVHTIGKFHRQNVFPSDFIYTIGHPPFTMVSDTKPKFDYSGGTVSKSLENGWMERCWAARIDSTDYDIETKNLRGNHDYFVIIESASTNWLHLWTWDGYVNELVIQGDVKGQYLETIYDLDGKYPNDGIKDGYWWVRIY